MGLLRNFFRRNNNASILSMSVHDMWCNEELRRRRAERERVNELEQKEVDLLA